MEMQLICLCPESSSWNSKPKERQRLLGERPESGARRVRWCDKAEERGGGGPGRQRVNRTGARGQRPVGINREGGFLLSTVQRTCCLETQLKTFISTVTKSLNYSLSKPCSVSLDVIKGSYPIAAEGEPRWITKSKSFPIPQVSEFSEICEVPGTEDRRTLTRTSSILWEMAFSWGTQCASPDITCPPTQNLKKTPGGKGRRGFKMPRHTLSHWGLFQCG